MEQLLNLNSKDFKSVWRTSALLVPIFSHYYDALTMIVYMWASWEWLSTANLLGGQDYHLEFQGVSAHWFCLGWQSGERLESNYCGTLVWKMWVNLYRSIIEEGFEYQFFCETAPSYLRKQLPLTNLPHMQLPSLLLICIIDQPRIRSKNTLRNEYFIASLMLVSLPKKSISMRLKIICGIQGTP